MIASEIPQLTCTQCGGELHPDEGQQFLTCPYCDARVHVDKTQVVFHWSLSPTMDANESDAALRRWMSGNQTVKDLDLKAKVVRRKYEYFPLWFFKWRSAYGEQIYLKPAAATSVTELSHLSLPAGDLKQFETEPHAYTQPPTVPLQAAQSWLREQAPQGEGEISESALVHIPIYIYRYLYLGQPYTAVVEAATGTVLANDFPHKSEAPYKIVGGVTAMIFFLLSTIPVIGAMINNENGLLIGLGIWLGLSIPAALLFYALAHWVASKI